MIEWSQQHPRKRLLRDAFALLLAAVASLALLAYLFSGMHWTSLSVAVNLTKRGAVSGQFVATWGVPYQIRLDTKRTLGLQQQYCLLGIETTVPDKCAEQPSLLGLSWVINQRSKTIRRGKLTTTRRAYLGPDMGIVLDQFSTLKGQHYTVSLTVTGPSPRLQASHPRLVVSVAPEARMWTYVSEGLLVVFTTFFIVLAILLLLSAFDVFGSGPRPAAEH